MESFTKSERKQLRTLAGIAYERELAAALAQLDGRFADWRAGKLSPFELSDALHQFHNGISRDLYSFYGGNPAICVAHGLAAGVLPAAEVPGDLAAKLRSLVEFYRTGSPPVESREPAV